MSLLCTLVATAHNVQFCLPFLITATQISTRQLGTACRKFPEGLVEPLFNKSSDFYATTITVRWGGLRCEEQLRR